MSKDTRPKPDLPLEETGAAADKTPSAERRRGWLHLLRVPVILAVLLLGAVLGLYFQPPGVQALFRATGLEPGGGTDTPIAVAIQQVTDQEEVAVISEGDVVALGRVIPRGDVTTVATPFGAGDARIAELRAAIGDTVEANQILAVLDSLGQYQGQLETAQANVAVSQATLQQTIASINASREEAVASLERSIAAQTVAAEELTRTRSLFDRGVTTQAVLDTAVSTAAQAERDVEKARATLSRYDGNGAGVQADVAVAEANLLSAQTQLRQAERDIEKAYVRAPSLGTVLDIHVSAGERPDSTGVLDLGDTSRMTVEAEVYQTMIGRVAIGDPVTITAPAISGQLSGVVTAVGIEIGRQSITSDDPAANTDARVVDVIVELDDASSAQAERLTNLQVVARIDAGRVSE